MINIPVDDLDTHRYVRQLRCVVRWMKESNARGTIEAATGFGKSTLGLIIKAKMKKFTTMKYNGKVIIVVPTTPLKKQWENIMKNLGFYENIEVHVINTVALSKGFYRDTDLLIIDEIHLMAADKFSRIFQRINYSWILGLTATLSRLDGKERLLKRFAPICDSISQKEAINKGWISDFIEFNLAVPVSRDEAERQMSLNKEVRYFMSKFGDFNLLLSCLKSENAKLYAQQNNYDEKDVMKWARQGMRVIQERKRLLEMPQRKIDVAVELIEEFDLKTITFSQAADFADAIADKLGQKAETYHSNMSSKTIKVDQKKVYKTEKGALNSVKKLRLKDGVSTIVYYESKKKSQMHIVKWKQEKVFGGSTLANLAMSKFKNNEISVLCSAKALDQGFDDPSVRLGVDGSRSINPTQHTQRTGRVARTFKLPDGKDAVKIYVNLYIPDWSVPNSRDEKKLRQCQAKNSESVVWVDDIHELKLMLKKILTDREQKPKTISA